jgi:hypothetical protein
MDTLLTILGGIVLISCLAYFYDQDAPNQDDRLFESAELMLTTDVEAEEPLSVPVPAKHAGGTVEG